mmetsp:Transcript_16006/g.18586  ORF Transcript_16006/g.18586 Transcript_16006/m.18586 type:complete len:134 (-) Transcript_16006:442-843(-)
MNQQTMDVLMAMVKVLGTTVGRDNICKVVQYFSMYLQASALRGERKMHPAFDKVHYNMWLTRKLLRFGLLSHYLKEILAYTKKKDVDKSEEQVGSNLERQPENLDKAKGEEILKDYSEMFDFSTSTFKFLSNI